MPSADRALAAPVGASDELTARVKALALELGFARVGIAAAEPLPEDAERLQAWLAAGYHGSMDYMQRTSAVRADPGHAGMLPGARSVIAMAAPYATGQGASGLHPGRVARYAQGRDYHNVLERRLRPLVKLLSAAGHAARRAVDSKPLLERAWAQRAGVGFIGKNCCLIVPGIGSHVFLASVVTTAELRPDAPMRERCGECEACLRGCPTQAFVAPRVLDARRCISYLTIEHRGPIDEALREPIADWLFGCDACQDVCPWNHGQASSAQALAAFAPGGRFEDLTAETLLELDDATFAQAFAGSPLRRPKREGVARNAAIVLGNRGAKRALPVLERAAEGDASEVVREAARWGLEQIAKRS
ncbi:MAG: tRNA epoxyqueuosine(34) reductase QueG [Polyangiales bacterium]